MTCKLFPSQRSALLGVCILLSATLISACSQSPTQSDANQVEDFLLESKLKKSGNTERIINFTIDSWKYLDPYHILITTRNRGTYLVSLRIDCRDLAHEIAIATTSTGGTLTKFDKIIYEDSFNSRQDCPIDEIIELEDIAED